MSYFASFPRLIYPLTVDGTTLVNMTLVDIMIRVNFKMTDEQLMKMTQPYDIESNDTPESISYKIYETPYYHWTILFTNNIIDPITDWYMSDEILLKYCQDKYGDAIDSPSCIVDDYGNIVGSADPLLTNFQSNETRYTNTKYRGNTTTISNYQYEVMMNEKKRTIRIIRPQYMLEFIGMFKALLNSGV